MSKNKQNTNNNVLNIILLFAAAIILICWSFLYSSEFQTTNNAVVEGRLMTISSRVSGFVSNIYVSEGQEVKKGDLILEIDSTDYNIRLRQAQDRLKTAKIKLGFCQKTAARELQEIPGMSNYDSYARVYSDEIIQKQPAETKIKLITEDKNNNNEEEKEEILDPKELSAEIQKLEAEIEQLKLYISYTKIYATQDGLISARTVKENDYVEIGETVFSIIPKRVWITANYDELQSEKIVAGQSAFVRIKKYPARRFKGVVDSIQPIVNNGFAKKVPVRIIFTEDYSEYNITPGTVVSASVKIK